MVRALQLHAAVAGLAFAAACFSPGMAHAQTGMTQIQSSGLPLTLIYPTAAKAAVQNLGPFTIEAAMGATPQRGNGRLVVLSHGSAGSAIADFDLARTLAGAGFVVAQPEHKGDSYRDKSLSGPESWKLRPLEVSKAIDAVMADPRFAPLLDAGKVGVHGMSAGGGTALALAGGEWSIAQLIRNCAANPKADAGFCFYGMRPGPERDQRAAAYAAGAMPPDAAVIEGGAKVRDPRIAAVSLIVPLGAVFTDDSLSRIAIPVGVVEATGDKVLVPAFHSSRVLALCKLCTPLGALPGAGHFDVLSPWPEPVARQVGQMPGWETSPGFDRTLLPASYKAIAVFFQNNLLP